MLLRCVSGWMKVGLSLMYWISQSMYLFQATTKGRRYHGVGDWGVISKVSISVRAREQGGNVPPTAGRRTGTCVRQLGVWYRCFLFNTGTTMSALHQQWLRRVSRFATSKGQELKTCPGFHQLEMPQRSSSNRPTSAERQCNYMHMWKKDKAAVHGSTSFRYTDLPSKEQTDRQSSIILCTHEVYTFS